jgi:hypothetical protein
MMGPLPRHYGFFRDSNDAGAAALAVHRLRNGFNPEPVRLWVDAGLFRNQANVSVTKLKDSSRVPHGLEASAHFCPAGPIGTGITREELSAARNRA